MTAPAFISAATPLAGNNITAANVPVPATSALTGLLDIVYWYIETTQAVTPPDGTWAEAANSPAVLTGSHNLRVFWRRPTGAETGTYAFTVAAGLQWREAIAIRYGGVIGTGSPFDFTTSAVKTTTTDGTTPAVSGTTTGADRLLVWNATRASFDPMTPPAGFTERAELATANGLAAADKAQAVAGATGSITGTWASPGATCAWMGALLPAAAASNAGQFFAMF